jgi:DNA-binding transcriptional ArsR family regulator
VDWYYERINLDYNDENLAENPHQEYLRRLEGKIMMFISSVEDGIGHLELASKVGIDRKNLTPHLKRLRRKGIVMRGKGKRGKYYPANKKYRGISVTADIVSRAAAGKILENEELPIDSPYFESGMLDNYSLDNALFKFSNGVGAIITYLIIQSMDRSSEIPGRDTKNAKEQDINVNRWFNDGISTLGAHLLTLFKEYMCNELLDLSYNNYVKEDGALDKDRVFADWWGYHHTPPLFTLDEKSIKSLMTSFLSIYPSIGVYLEKIRSQFPHIVNLITAQEEYRRIRDKQQKICNHDFRPPRDTFYSKNEFLHCTKCHKTKRKSSSI